MRIERLAVERTLLALLGIISSLVFAACSPTAAAAVPRYRFTPGQELVYEGHGESADAAGRGKSISHGTWHVWVTRQNANGSWHLLLQYESRFEQIIDGRALGRNRSDVQFAWCDIHPDGTIEPNPTIGLRVSPGTIFPTLPRDEAHADHWSAAGEEDAATIAAMALPATRPSVFQFKAVSDSAMNRIYLSTHESTYTFDTDRGLVTGTTSAYSQAYGIDSKGTGATELTSLTTTDVGSLAAEAEAYFRAREVYDHAIESAMTAGDNSKSVLATALTDLNTAAAKAAHPAIAGQFKTLVKEHADTADYVAKSVSDRAEIVGHPSPEWTCADLSGVEHKMSEYRGKVVVLDFWYRGCGWCIRAMPQMNLLAGDFKNRPVAILGMNTDLEEKNAEFVVKTMELAYPTLKARGIPEKYKVQGFPTLLIIDQEGIVREVHVGYSPTIRKTVGSGIESLLKAPPAK